jgi:serine/threonine protein kinase
MRHATMQLCNRATLQPCNHATETTAYRAAPSVLRHHHVSASNRRVLWGLNGSAQADPSVPVTTEMKVSFALDVANGMAFIAEHNFIHRDLASRNVVLDANMVCSTPPSCHPVPPLPRATLHYPFLVPPSLPCYPLSSRAGPSRRHPISLLFNLVAMGFL